MTTEPRPCAVCGEALPPRRQIVCSQKCRTYRQNHSEAYKRTKKRYYEGGGPRLHAVTCRMCDQDAKAYKADAQFCSLGCYNAWQARPILGPPAPRGWTRRPDVACSWCDEMFHPRVAGQRFCSLQCVGMSQRRGPNGIARRQRFKITAARRQRLYERDEWICQLCGDPVNPDLPVLDDWAATLDHIVPQSYSETPDHSDGNLRLAHRWCNSVRGDGREDLFT